MFSGDLLQITGELPPGEGIFLLYPALSGFGKRPVLALPFSGRSVQ
jgi:hypothetical protein